METPRKTGRLKRTQCFALTFLMLAGIVNYLDRSTLSIGNVDISRDLGLNASEMGLLLSAFSLAYAFSQLPVGALLDKLGARAMLGAGMLVWSLAQMSAGLVGSLNQFLVARVFLGLGEAPQFPAGAKVVSEWFALRERGGPTGIFVASRQPLARRWRPPILTGLMLAFDWRTMLAPFITGVVVDKTHSFINALLISAAVAFAAALVYMFVVDKPIEGRGLEHCNTGRPMPEPAA